MLRSHYVLLLLCFVLSLSISSSTSAQEPITVVPTPETQEQDKALAKLKAGIQKRITVDFKGTPLAEVVAYLQEKTGVPFRIDHRALDDVGLLDDTPITIKLKQVRLKILLRLMLRQLDLTWVYSENRIEITTPDEADGHLEARHHYVLDLVMAEGHQEPSYGQEPDYDFIIELMFTTIEPGSWDFSGPPPVYIVDGGIVFEQTDYMHEKVAALFDTLRTVKKLPNKKYDVTPIDIMGTDPSIQEKLAKPIQEVNFKGAPLPEVMNFLSEAIDLNIFIDQRSLDDIRLSPSFKVSGQWKNASAKTILRDLLTEHDLAYMMHDDVVMIATLVETEFDLITKVYPVRDFAAQDTTGYELLNWSSDYDELISAISATIEPYSWARGGGPGSCSAFELADCLVISQTDEVHQKIKELLTRIRLKRKGQPIDKPWLVNAGQPFVHAYTLPGLFGQQSSPTEGERQKSLERLMTLITSKVEPDSWENDANTIETIGDRLIVTQVRATHLKIYRFLEDLGFLNSTQRSHRGFGGRFQDNGFGGGGASGAEWKQSEEEPEPADDPSDPPMQGGFF
ncbi:MAG: hypothetical protein COA78_02335 [Blastopirellula sp.]|nr:MAG: hypothetical protein COA78_02335 [Blastopirellula sp.]